MEDTEWSVLRFLSGHYIARDEYYPSCVLPSHSFFVRCVCSSRSLKCNLKTELTLGSLHLLLVFFLQED